MGLLPLVSCLWPHTSLSQPKYKVSGDGRHDVSQKGRLDPTDEHS